MPSLPQDSVCGCAALSQEKYAEAEPLLLEGCEGLQQRAAKIPPQARPRLREALERLVQLYEATGNVEKADVWRRQLEAHRLAEKKVEQPKGR
jgi:eukaryotic-like serine/threonine-protein kinase